MEKILSKKVMDAVQYCFAQIHAKGYKGFVPKFNPEFSSDFRNLFGIEIKDALDEMVKIKMLIKHVFKKKGKPEWYSCYWIPGDEPEWVTQAKTGMAEAVNKKKD